MMKYKLLIVLNIIFAFFISYINFSNSFSFLIPFSLDSLLHHYLPSLIMIVFILINIWSAWKLFKTKDNKQFKLSFISTIHTIFWFLLLLIGYFVADNVFFLVVSLLITGIIFFWLKKVSLKLAISFTSMTVLLIILCIAFAFEESYCWNKGEQADPTGSQMVQLTNQEDKKLAEDHEVLPDQLVGVAFLVHMRCHKDFNFSKALQEKYFLQNE